MLSDDWKQEITERLDRYRAHRPQTAAQPALPVRTPADSRATKIARAVASRYAAAPTYSELLSAAAEEAARAEALAAEQQRVQQAAEAAAIEAAAIEASAIEAAGNLFQDIDSDPSAQPSPIRPGKF